MRRQEAWLVAFCVGDVFAAALAMGVVSLQMKALGLGPAAAGLVGSVYGALQTVSGPVAGWASDTYGRKVLLCGACAGIAVGYALLAAAALVGEADAGGGAPGGVSGAAAALVGEADAGGGAPGGVRGAAVGLLVLSRAVTGATKHTASTSKALAADATRSAGRGARASLLGRMNMGASLGFMVAPLLSARLLEATGSYAAPAALASVAFAALVPVAAAAADASGDAGTSGGKSGQSRAESSPLKGVRALLAAPRVRALLACRLCLGIGVSVFRQAMQLLFTYHFELDARQQGYITAAFSLLGALSQGLGVAPVQRRLGTEKAYAAGLALLAVCYGLIASAGNLWMFLAVVPAIGLVAGLARPLGAALLTHSAPAAATGQALAAADVVMSLARAGAPAAAGAAVALSPSGAAVGAPAAAALLVGAAAFIAFYLPPEEGNDNGKKND